MTIKINDRTSGETKRYSLQDVQLTETVAAVKARISQQNEVSTSHFNVIYCGQMLQDNCLLTMYGIKDGITLYVLPSREQAIVTPAQENKPSVKEIQTAVKSMLKFHSIMERVVHSHKFQGELVSKVPGLATDPLAMSMLQQPDVLEKLMDPHHGEKLINNTPCIGPAIIILAEEVKKVNTFSTSTFTSLLVIFELFSSPGTNVLGEVLSYPRHRCRCRWRRQFQVKVFVY